MDTGLAKKYIQFANLLLTCSQTLSKEMYIATATDLSPLRAIGRDDECEQEGGKKLSTYHKRRVVQFLRTFCTTAARAGSCRRIGAPIYNRTILKNFSPLEGEY